MGFCTLCKSIPLEALPPIPSKWIEGMCIKPWTMVNEWYPDDEEDQRLFLKEPFGFQHQPSFKALAVSADSCELCALLNESITARIAEYESREAYPVFQMRLNEQERGAYQLWLTKRVDDGDGF